MTWFKIAAIAACVLIVFIVVSSLIGYLIEAAIALLVIAAAVLGAKAMFRK
jgi:hypothetical protein